MNRLPSPELFVMLPCHNYENVSIHILREELVSFSFTFYVEILADVHVCIYVMILYVFMVFYWIVIVFYDTLSEMTK